MKYLSISLLLLFAFVSGCEKKVDVSNSSTTNLAMVPKSIPAFKINNMLSGNYVVEGKNLRLENNSQKAVSYHWDFGNGITYDGKTPPTDIYYVPCGGDYTITLTTKNTAGDASVYSQSFNVLCSGKMTHGEHLPN